jgi:hypothetical protein
VIQVKQLLQYISINAIHFSSGQGEIQLLLNLDLVVEISAQCVWDESIDYEKDAAALYIHEVWRHIDPQHSSDVFVL